VGTIAIIACCDTKQAEVDFVRKHIIDAGHGVVVIDISTSSGFVSRADVTREEVIASAGYSWQELDGQGREVLFPAMAKGAEATLTSLASAGRIDGVIGMGGLQNTTISTQGMRALPIGFPKLIVSTVVSGNRTFDRIVGTRDVTMMPSITDLAGINLVSEAILANAAGAIAGMVEHGVRGIARPANLVVGATLMGATNDGVVGAVDRLEAAGQPTMCFHSTGVGGAVMEELIASGMIGATMDLTLHEIVYEYFGGGFGAGTKDRLSAGAKAGIPMLVTPGGIDFICQWKNELFPDINDRLMIWHNAQLAHVKLKVEESRAIAKLIVERLNTATGPVRVLFPTKGLRSFADVGQPLYDPAVDEAILEELRNGLRTDIPVTLVQASLVSPEFSKVAADTMLEMIRNAA